MTTLLLLWLVATVALALMFVLITVAQRLQPAGRRSSSRPARPVVEESRTAA